MPVHIVTKTIEFCYGHRLLDYDGKCRYLHGHNALLEVDIESDSLDGLGMVMDFGDVRDRVKGWIDANLDHRMLLCRRDPIAPILTKMGEPLYLMDDNPTAREHIQTHLSSGTRAGSKGNRSPPVGDSIKSIHLPRIILMDRVAVLASGGLDSSVLLADIARHSIVFPIYVQVGLAWEKEERQALASFLDGLNSPNVRPVTALSLPIQPLYHDHWSVTGLGVTRFRRAGQRCIPSRPKCPAYRARCSMVQHARRVEDCDRLACRQSIPRRDAGVLRHI